MLTAYAQPTETEIAVRFADLARRWREETGMLSSSTARAMHPAYKQVIGLGPAVLPILLKQIEYEPEAWFWALKAITGDDPVPPGIGASDMQWLLRGYSGAVRMALLNER